MLREIAHTLIGTYTRDLRRLREAAGRLQGSRRSRSEYFLSRSAATPADARTLASARTLGLPADPKKLAALVRGRRQFVRLVAALIQVELEHKQDEILAAAR